MNILRMADTLRVKGAFMPLLATMTAVGEETGNIDDVMKEVSDFHRSQLSSLICTLSAWATPVIVIVVGSIVGYCSATISFSHTCRSTPVRSRHPYVQQFLSLISAVRANIRRRVRLPRRLRQ